MRTILVTGGAGFIGSNFIYFALQRFPTARIINLDKLTYAGNLANLAPIADRPNYQFIQGDIADPMLVEEVFATNDIDWVINFAAESHVDRSIQAPEVFVRTNVYGTFNLLNYARKYWAIPEGFRPGKKFLQVSTDEVYGSLGPTGFFTEKTPLDPHSPYSASKAGADLFVQSYFDTYGLPIHITRCSNNYGPFQYPEKLIPLIIDRALQKQPVPIYGDGLNVRDWLYVEDHCLALCLVLEKGRIGEVYNIGGHNERTNLQIAQAIIGYLHEHADGEITEDLIQFVADRKGHDRRYGIDPSKIVDELGWRPCTTFEEGIARTIRWYLEHREWMVLSRSRSSKTIPICEPSHIHQSQPHTNGDEPI